MTRSGTTCSTSSSASGRRIVGRAASQPTPADEAVVEAQLGRRPRGRWWVEARCGYGFPQVVGTPPDLGDAGPFPTLYWLSCPWLLGVVSQAESAGGASQWAARFATDPALATRMRAADAAYRARRAKAASPRPDPCADVGIAGQADPLATKCLHAHVAAALAGIDDPVGGGLLADAGRECPDGRCAALTCLREEGA